MKGARIPGAASGMKGYGFSRADFARFLPYFVIPTEPF